jgi:deoxyribonuclease IV
MKMQIGAHVSMAGGIDKAVERASVIGCNSMQVFSGSPRSWARAEINSINLDKYFSKRQKLGIKSVFIHSLYLINLVSEKPELYQKSISSVIYDLRFGSVTKADGVIIHIGSHLGKGFDSVKKDLVKTIKDILKNTPEDSRLLLENTAGQKGKIGKLEEIKWLMDQVKSKRLGWCFDTCHGFAAGLNLDEVDVVISGLGLWESLACIHVNDSRDQFNSHRDRHDNLGDGEIEAASLKKFLNLKQIKSLPLILEVPGMDKKGPDGENVRRLKELVE